MGEKNNYIFWVIVILLCVSILIFVFTNIVNKEIYLISSVLLFCLVYIYYVLFNRFDKVKDPIKLNIT
jgi:hypothetical protein